MGISPLFDLEKVLFLPYLPSKSSQEVEIWNVHFGSLDFSALFPPSQPQKSSFLVIFSPFFQFVPPITSFQMKLGT